MEPQQVTNIADSNPSSETTTSAMSSSAFEGARGGDISENDLDPFYNCIQPWHFELLKKLKSVRHEKEKNVKPPYCRCDLNSEECECIEVLNVQVLLTTDL